MGAVSGAAGSAQGEGPAGARWRAGRARRSVAMAFLAAAFVALGACSDSGTGPEEDNGPPTFTVNAVSDTIFVSLGEAPRTVSVSDRSASTAWDLAISTTVILANGGVDGPGGVTVHCICQNVGATGTQIAAMTPQSELAAFTAVTAA